MIFIKKLSFTHIHLLESLKDKISKTEQISVDSIMIGNGGSELITLIARMLAGKKVLVLQPTFSEYEKACRANHCEVLSYQLEEPQPSPKS